MGQTVPRYTIQVILTGYLDFSCRNFTHRYVQAEMSDFHRGQLSAVSLCQQLSSQAHTPDRNLTIELFNQVAESFHLMGIAWPTG